jgi:hypothetical protein
MGKIILYGFFYVCVQFHGKFIIKYDFFSPFVEIGKCDKVLQIKILFCWTIISFICAFISQHNARLKHKHHVLRNFSENYFPNFHHDI